MLIQNNGGYTCSICKRTYTQKDKVEDEKLRSLKVDKLDEGCPQVTQYGLCDAGLCDEGAPS